MHHNPGGPYIQLDDGTRIKYHPTRSPFAPIAPACGSYTVDGYTDDTVTITHDDPALSGTYDLNFNWLQTNVAKRQRDKLKELFPNFSNANARKLMRIMVRCNELAQDDDDD